MPTHSGFHSGLMYRAAQLRQVAIEVEQLIADEHFQQAASVTEKALEIAREIDYDLRTVNRVRAALGHDEK